MSEEIVEASAEASPAEEPKVLSTEEKARTMGWKPLEEYKGDPDAWVDSKEFVSRSSFFKKINSLNEKLQQQEQILRTVHQQMSVTEQRAYQQAINDVKAQMNEARLSGDFDAYEDAVKRQNQLAQQVPQQPQQGFDPRNTDGWKKFEVRNDWVNKNDLDSQILKATALVLTQNYEKEHPGSTVEEVCEHVHATVRLKHPEKFLHEKSSSPSALGVGRGGVSSSESQDSKYSGLSPAQVEAVKYYENLKLDTKELISQFRKGKK